MTQALQIRRINWIDWMKAIGMYLIIYGHCFTIGNKFIYVFNVPVFFLISGFLSKHEDDFKVFWKKLFYNLIVPMLILSTVYYLLIHILNIINGSKSTEQNILDFIIGLFIGEWESLKTSWFIYTLVICKIIYQLTPPYKQSDYKSTYYKYHIIFIILLSTIAIILTRYNLQLTNSIANVAISYQFFILGVYGRNYKEKLCNLSQKQIKNILIISTIIVILCGILNGHVRVYNNIYGNSFTLYLIGGIAGSCLLFAICKYLDKYTYRWVNDISVGSVIILAIHPIILKIIPRIAILDIFTSFFVLISFVPIIRFAKKNVPIIVGKMRK